MSFIIFDLEFNQDFTSLQNYIRNGSCYPFEIIQIGAIKLDQDFNIAGTFNRYIKPTIYSKISPFIAELTGISAGQLVAEEPFPEVYEAYISFIRETDAVLCVWGMADIKELYKNVEYHQLNQQLLPKMFINLQPYASKYFKEPRQRMLGLKHTVELLDIPVTHPFHNAFNDALYTAEVFKKIYSPSIQPKPYDPAQITVKHQPRKREIDAEKLIKQFEKMYDRSITEQEQSMILLAYKMGRTNQFLKIEPIKGSI